MPFFTHPVTKKRIPIAEEISLDGAERKLNFSAEKEAGWSPGGWYKNAAGQEFMVKFCGAFSYAEKLLNDLAKVCVGKDFVAAEVEIGHGDFDGREQPCLVSSKLAGYRDLVTLESEKEKKSHAEKFHCFYAFCALTANDDLNEDNLGINDSSNPFIIDYGIVPTFLNREQIEHAGTPFHLASLIGHRNLNGVQFIRKKYFGHDEFLNPRDRLKPQKEKLKTEDISYLSVLIGIRAIVENKDQIIHIAEENFAAMSDDPSLTVEEKKLHAETFGKFAEILQRRIEWMEREFSPDLASLGDESEQKRFAAIKWRLHPKFTELMKVEKEIFHQCATKNLEENFTEISELLSGRTKDEILALDLRTVEKSDLRECVKKNFMLHNALISGDFKTAKWLVENDLSDINQHRNLRNHNYQFFRLTPLHTVIAIYHDALTYEAPSKLEPLQEMITILSEKFREKNGATFDSARDYRSEGSDGFAIKMTFMALEKLEQKASPEALAATTIQRAFRAHRLAQEETSKGREV